MRTSDHQKPCITDYTDYATYVGDLVKYKRKHEDYTLRVFCQKSGFKSPAYLKWIIDNTRSISLKSIHQFVDGLELDPKEAHYFSLMVNYKEAKNARARHYFYEEMLTLKTSANPKEQYEYLSRWYYVAIRELTAHPEFQEDAHWIQKHLYGDLGLVEIKHAIKTLERLKLLIRDKKGKLTPHDTVLNTGDEIQSHAAYNYHTNVLELSKEILIKTKQKERNFSSVATNMDDQAFQDINAMAKDFQNKVVNYLTNPKVMARLAQTNNQELYMLNMQLLPFSKTAKKKDSL